MAPEMIFMEDYQGVTLGELPLLPYRICPLYFCMIP